MGWGRNTAYLGGSFVLLILLKRFTRGQSASSSHQAVQVHQTIDRTQQPEDGVSDRTIHQRGLENEEPKMPDHLSGNKADCPLIKWLQQREDNGIKPLATFEVQGLPTQTYVRDEIKVLIKSLIEFIQDLHSQGQCMSGTDFEKNISVVGGKFKFDKLELCSLTEELQQKDYNYVERTITMVIFRKKAKQLPHDMRHLLKLLKNPRPHIYLISKHVALMNLKSCRNLYMSLWDTKKAMNSTACSKWKNAVQDLKIRSWSKSISKESPLFNVYQSGKYGGDKVNLIRFVRNAAAHLNEQSGKGERFQFEHISLIITATFPTLLADSQEKLHHYGILQEFL